MQKMSKKLINLPENCVDEMLDGVVKAHPGLSLHANYRVILTKQWADTKKKVALLSGGGSGHEPFAAAGTLVFIPNYTGDCLNFGLAVEWAKSEGLKVESIVLGEDCALLGQDSSVGRRGMCGMVFIFKIAGAMVEEGKSLTDIAQTVRMVLRVLASYGVSLSACSLPGSGPLFKIGTDEMELGLGVHGEAGIKRVKIRTATETVKIILEAIIGTLKLKSGDEVVVLINNLGGTSQLEQWLVTGEVHKQFTTLGIAVLRIYAACIMTSLEMAGIQVSALKISGAHKEDWLNYLDAETKACAWCGSPMSIPPEEPLKDTPPPENHPEEHKLEGPTINAAGSEILRRCLEAVALSVISNEGHLNELDSACGDGDTGTTLRRMADGILLQLGTLPVSHPSTLLKQLSSIAEMTMGGTSGALYSLMLTMTGTALGAKVKAVTARTWAVAWIAGTAGTLRYSQAKLGDRSMFDALLPACMKFESYKPSTVEEGLRALEAAVVAAEEGCEKTRYMKARVGRATYVDATHVTDVDAGAYGVTVWLKAVFNELKTCFQ
ncbi:triokinase/FMN cyclase isoform X2 [Cryptotermes secundus]|uniref:triokinase/FMN cyclase isoform X2 n=1 Tax=Cryptotermes secundus TaxID=105785 RepID=UPI000CD7D4A4|nr:triokinase/FMN cyclase isoform X2 [Cryptotermes secundus]